MEQEIAPIAEEAAGLLHSLSHVFLLGGIGFVIIWSLKRFWTDTVIYVLMRWSDSPRFSSSEDTGCEICIEGVWWKIQKIESPLFGGGKVFFKRDPEGKKQDKCKTNYQLDMGLEEYYYGAFQYRT